MFSKYHKMSRRTATARVRNRGLLLSALESESLVTKIRVSGKGLLGVETQDWSSYWAPVQRLACAEPTEALDRLRFAWSNYVLSGFAPELRREFCVRYFFC